MRCGSRSSSPARLPVAPAKVALNITVWRDTLAGRDIKKTGQLIRDNGLSIVSLCRGGFFPAATAADRAKALDDNRLAISEAHALGAPLIVLVCGAVPGQSLVESRKQITDGIAALLPECKAANVKLAIEPLHPMQAAFKEHHGLQCGFCTPGMVMSAIDMVKRHNYELDEATVRRELVRASISR